MPVREIGFELLNKQSFDILCLYGKLLYRDCWVTISSIQAFHA